MRWGASAVFIVLLLPLAEAAEAAGELEAQLLSLPSEAKLTARDPTLFVRDAAQLQALGHAPRLTVRVFEERLVTAPIPGIRPVLQPTENRTVWTVHDAAVSITPSRPGWLGIRAQGGEVSSSALSIQTVTSKASLILGDPNASVDDNEELPYFRAKLSDPTLVQESGSWTLSGSARIKLMGPTVALRANENETTIETGQMPDPSNPLAEVRRYVILEVQSGNFSFVAPATLASIDVQVSWDGVGVLHGADGKVANGIKEWRATGADSQLDGAFRAELRPARDHAAIIIGLQGDLRATSMTPWLRSPTAPGSFTGWILLVAAAALGAGSAATRAWRRSRSHPDLEVEELASVADAAADAEEFARAATLLRLAREQSPASTRLALDQAYFLWRDGKSQAALRILNERVLAGDPDALQLKARILLRAGDEPAAAQAFIDALERAPVLVLDIDGDAELERLTRRTDVSEAVRRARGKTP